eukprot:gene13812-16322_t
MALNEDLAASRDFMKLHKGLGNPPVVPGTYEFKSLQLEPPADRIHASPNAFLTHLFKMIEDPKNDDVICWGDDEISFYIWRPNEFETIFPKYFGAKASFHTFRQKLGELGFERLDVNERRPARGRKTLVANWWAFENPRAFKRSMMARLSPEEFNLPVWPIDAWNANISDDYAWMATMNPGKPIELSLKEKEDNPEKIVKPYTETRFPVY